MAIALPPPGLCYRLLGREPGANPRRRIGCGVMDKSGRAVDFLDFVPGTWSLVWILRGSGSHEDDQGRRWPLAAGDCFQRWPGRRISTRIDPDSGYYEIFLDLGLDLHQGLEAVGVFDARPVVWRLGLEAGRLARWLAVRDALPGATPRRLAELCVLVQGLVVDALAATDPVADPEDPVAAACRRLAADPAGRDDLGAFCAGLGLEYATFRKQFRRRMGLSLGQYRLQCRLDQACARLQGTTQSIAGIAADLGYVSPFEFSAQFRRRFGRSPRAWRAQERGS